MIHGHTHRPATHALADGLQRWVLSDWHLDGSQARAEVLRLQRVHETNTVSLRRLAPDTANATFN
jgi:UDP-2,3-diacylglucosamine hydrolase